MADDEFRISEAVLGRRYWITRNCEALRNKHDALNGVAQTKG
jgi:hypothetical protein